MPSVVSPATIPPSGDDTLFAGFLAALLAAH
jgi:hypothetical protein